MPLVLRELALADIPAVVDITNNAFRDDPVTPALYPDGQTPVTRAFAISRQTSRFGKEPNVHKLGVFDTDLPAAEAESRREEEPDTRGMMIATATWLLEDPTMPDNQIGPQPPMEWPIGVSAAAHKAYFVDMPEHYNAVMGEKRCWHLMHICTHTEHQRRGAAKILLEWGTSRADNESLECFVDGSPAGLSTYKRAGFVIRKEFELDLRRFGVEHTLLQYGMVRPPKTSQ